MATLTIKNIPDPVVRRLKARAAQHRRSLNAEVIHMLESSTRTTPVSVEEELARIRALRPGPPLRFTQRQLKAWVNEGRM